MAVPMPALTLTSVKVPFPWKRNWIKIRLVGTKSNRSGIGSKVMVTAQTDPAAERPLVQLDELRSGGSYFSQNDMRLHFGLDQATKVTQIQVRWLSGQIDHFRDLDVNRLYVLQEGGTILQSVALAPARSLIAPVSGGHG